MEKIPCIKCNSELWEYIRPFLARWNYYNICITNNWDTYPILVVNYTGIIGKVSNVCDVAQRDRELVIDVEEFLEKAAKLKGFTYKRKDMKEFTLKDLKPGMVVEYRNKDKRLVVLVSGELHFIGSNGVFPSIKEGYNDDLTYKVDDELDIIKVYKVEILSALDTMFNTSNHCLKLIWEREEVKEVTMQEIADKFGIPVEQLRIKK